MGREHRDKRLDTQKQRETKRETRLEYNHIMLTFKLTFELLIISLLQNLPFLVKH